MSGQVGLIKLDSSELQLVFSLCDVAGKGYITSKDLRCATKNFENSGNDVIDQILSALQLGPDDKMDFISFQKRIRKISCLSSSEEENFPPNQQETKSDEFYYDTAKSFDSTSSGSSSSRSSAVVRLSLDPSELASALWHSSSLSVV